MAGVRLRSARRHRRERARTAQRALVAAVCRALENKYHSPHHGNKADPLDELVYIILSQMTTAPSFTRVFSRLERSIRDWSGLLRRSRAEIGALIAGGGLSGQKSANLKAIARRLKADFGSVTLGSLAHMDDAQAEAYLISLPGVGIKTAKCVLMYSFGRRVLPVDTHVARVSRRLGLLPTTLRTPRGIHGHLESFVKPRFRYSYHVNAIALGRDVCAAVRPRCRDCVLSSLCPTAPRLHKSDLRRPRTPVPS